MSKLGFEPQISSFLYMCRTNWATGTHITTQPQTFLSYQDSQIANKFYIHYVLRAMAFSMSDCHPGGPRFDSRLYPRNFSRSIGSGMGSTQPREANWLATWYEKLQNPVKKTEIKVEGLRFANHKIPCTAIWQQPLQSVLALWSCSATDLFYLLCIESTPTRKSCDVSQ